MFFDVDDPELLEGIEVNGQVEFELIKTADDRRVIADMETTQCSGLEVKRCAVPPSPIRRRSNHDGHNE